MPDVDATFLGGVLSQVLEDAAFVFAEPADEPERWDAPTLQATLDFESVRGGRLRLLAAPSVGVELAANMLGLEPSDPEANENGLAAVAEILNVIGGAFVTRLFGTNVPSQLGLPVPESLGRPPDALPRTCAAAVRLEGGGALVLELDLEPARTSA